MFAHSVTGLTEWNQMFRKDSACSKIFEHRYDYKYKLKADVFNVSSCPKKVSGVV